MRYLVISDLHSNLEALQAVLTAAKDRYERVICCGDLVGYGPDPNPVVDWVRDHAVAVVRGNHDKASCGVTDAEDFNHAARAAALWTRGHLTVENLDYLRALPVGPLLVDGFQIVHGSAQDEDEYIFVAQDAYQDFPMLGHRLTFFGHTHLQGGFVRMGGGLVVTVQPSFRTGLAWQQLELQERDQYLLNPGSVGQPRDGDSRAAFAIYDSGAGLGLVEYWRTPYDFTATQRKMAAANLPEVLSRRLALGR